MRGMTGYDRFLSELRSIPWFSRVGQPADDRRVDRIRSWDEWPGAESPLVEAVHLDQQKFHDELRAEYPSDLAGFNELVQEIVDHVSPSVREYDPDEDSWHAPSTAVWHAAWTAALVAHYVKVDRAVPSTIGEQWTWFLRGHWPAAYRRLSTTEEPEGLIVY